MKKISVSDIHPTLVLVIIALVVTTALAFTYGATKPVIENMRGEEANAARRAVLPAADTFGDVTKTYAGKMPETVTAVFEADGGEGYVLTVTEKGFGGAVEIMVGMDGEGALTGVKALNHAETPGLGTKAMTPEYLAQYDGLSDIKTDKLDTDRAEADEIDTITGATITSNAVYRAVDAALAFYRSNIKEAKL